MKKVQVRIYILGVINLLIGGKHNTIRQKTTHFLGERYVNVVKYC